MTIKPIIWYNRLYGKEIEIKQEMWKIRHTLYLTKEIDEIIYKKYVVGQLSDGLYENIKDMVNPDDYRGSEDWTVKDLDRDMSNHWKVWKYCDVDIFHKHGVTFRNIIHDYSLGYFLSQRCGGILIEEWSKELSIAPYDFLSSLTRINMAMGTDYFSGAKLGNFIYINEDL